MTSNCKSPPLSSRKLKILRSIARSSRDISLSIISRKLPPNQYQVIYSINTWFEIHLFLFIYRKYAIICTKSQTIMRKIIHSLAPIGIQLWEMHPPQGYLHNLNIQFKSRWQPSSVVTIALQFQLLSHIYYLQIENYF